LIRNLNPSKVFLIIQTAVLLLAASETYLSNRLADQLDDFTAFVSPKAYGFLFSIFFIILTYLLLRQTKSLNPNKIKIVCPRKLLFISLAIETLSLCKLFSIGQIGEGAREAINSGSFNLGILRLNTPFLYLLVMLHFGSLGWNPRNVGVQSILISLYIIILFLLKDIIFGSRGSFTNALCFCFAGLSFFNKIKIFNPKNIIVFLCIALPIFLVLTSIRSNKIASTSEIYSTILIKFSANYFVATNFLNNELYVTTKLESENKTTWYHVKPIYKTSVAEIDQIQYFSTLNVFDGLKRLITKTKRDWPTTYYFKMYGDYPFNSASYLFKVFLFGKYSILALIMPFILFWILANSCAWGNFFVYCLFFYFSLLSFTANAFFEIPFCVLPFLGVIFKKSFVSCRDL
jgi:hypothetical protein